MEQFKIGKKYKILKFDELKQKEEVRNVYEDVLNCGEFLHYYIKDMDNIENRIFTANSNSFCEVSKSNFSVEPWMCEEIKLNLDNVGETSKSTSPNLTKVVKHSEICKKLNLLYKSKNHDYGDSFGETFKKLGVISAITRITDKVNRLQSLATKDAEVDESIKDTLMDLANYSIMTIIEMEGEE